jgi:hypothetical protein
MNKKKIIMTFGFRKAVHVKTNVISRATPPEIQANRRMDTSFDSAERSVRYGRHLTDCSRGAHMKPKVRENFGKTYKRESESRGKRK